jgi:GNAT superfamily N-acetyltransferase
MLPSEALTIRLMTEADVDSVPLDHQGSAEEVRARIAELGSCAVLVFDGEQHVGQLQFRRFAPAVRSPGGLMDPLYWGDFSGVSAPALPPGTLNLYCYHVGQLAAGDARDVRYQGRGIGARLLDVLLDWASTSDRSDGTRVDAVVAKAVPPHRAIAAFMGGQPAAVYEARGFDSVARWHDPELRAALDRMLAGELGEESRSGIQELVDRGVELDAAAEVAMCVRRFG